MLPESQKPKRITAIDTAKAIGIFLVFYGHMVDRFAGLGSQIAFDQYKLIYSFHMPFFFIVAGFFFRQKFQSRSKEIKLIFYRRMLPMFFFSLIALPIWFVYLYLVRKNTDFSIILGKIIPHLKGETALNPITWFLICLFWVEVIALFIFPKIKSRLVGLLIAAFFLTFGLFLTADNHLAETLFGIEKNTWYIFESLVAFGLYALGYYTFDYLKPLLTSNRWLRLCIAVLAVGVTLRTYNLNNPYQIFVVVMKESWHGYPLWFIITGIAGTLMLLFVSSLIPYNKAVDFIGKNTLILLGMNGLTHTFINLHICTRVNNLESVWIITLVSLITSIVSVLFSVPIILLFNRYIPQLIGQPLKKGPLLPALIKNQS